MKANLILPFCMMFLCVESFAQDVIHTVDLRPIEAKVLEITDDYVRYKTFDNLEGPDYRISVSRIIRIVFENGTEKVFTLSSPFASSYYGPARGPVRYHGGYFYDAYGRIDARRQDALGIALYGSDYRIAKSQSQWGLGLTVIGATDIASALILGAMTSSLRHDEFFREGTAVPIAFAVMGVCCLGAGIPIWISGNRRLNKIADDYNQQFRSSNGYGYAPSVELKSGANGVGLALRF